MNIFQSPQYLYVALMGWVRSRFDFKNDTGATAVEYGLIVALIAAVIVATVGLLGGEVETAFKTVCNGIKAGTC